MLYTLWSVLNYDILHNTNLKTKSTIQIITEESYYCFYLFFNLLDQSINEIEDRRNLEVYMKKKNLWMIFIKEIKNNYLLNKIYFNGINALVDQLVFFTFIFILISLTIGK